MTTVLKDSRFCPDCGQPLHPLAPGGLCPACLMAQGGETEPASPTTPPTPLSTKEIAALFPQFSEITPLGAGGMGAVFKAHQPSLDRWIALKILPSNPETGGAVDQHVRERFQREARALARLNHPNIVTVHEFGVVGNLRFIVMEYVDGTNLRQLERAGRLSPREALLIIPQICDALQYAHDEGVVHRDIKPENILIDRRGRVKIADFGLAKITESEREPGTSRLTLDGQVMGTPHYMAPEQVERPLAVDHRADIFSLGVVFYEMLTGDLPLGKFAPPSRKVQVDIRLDDIVLRALENDPERRYQQASQVKQRVENLGSGGNPSPASAAPAPAPAAGDRASSGRKQPRRRVLAAFLGSGVVLLGTLGLVRPWLLGTVIPWFEDRAFPAQTATLDSERGTMLRELPGGGTLELLALLPGGPETRSGWLPDGTPTTAYRSPGFTSSFPARVTAQAIFRVKDLPEGNNRQIFVGSHPAAVVAYARFDSLILREGEPQELTRATFEWEQDLTRATLRAGISLEPPLLAATYRVATRTTELHHPQGLPAGPVGVQDVSESPEGVRFSVMLANQHPLWRSDVVAVDWEGNLHSSSSAKALPSNDFLMWTHVFKGLGLREIESFRVRMHPIHWVSFPRVPVKAPASTVRPRPPTFEEAAPERFEGWLDFDTGRLAVPPVDAQAQENPFAGFASDIQWALENGIDAYVGSESIDLLNTRLAAVTEEEWRRLGPAELPDLLQGRPGGGNRISADGGARKSFAAHYAYQTRAGGRGLLRVTRDEDQPAGWVLQFRRLRADP